MPYIAQGQRYMVNDEISKVSDAIRATIGSALQQRAGAMNYAVSKLIKEVYGENLNYSTYNEIVGILECCKMEFYRAQAAPYEDQKRKENGPV